MLWYAKRLGASLWRSQATATVRHRLSGPEGHHQTVFRNPAWFRRSFSTIEEHQQEIDAINDMFAEAREEIEYATEDKDTVYFNASATEARKVADKVFVGYDSLLDKLTPDERAKLQRSMGLKMEQLKAELEMLDTAHD